MFLAAIDQGTTSTRCALFDRTSLAGMSQHEHRQIFPQPGWVEHDPIEIWQRTQQVIAAAMRQARELNETVGAIGITNQRETLVVWNRRSGHPVCNAIVWQDLRTKSICDELAENNRAMIEDTTGLPPATYFSGPKLRWILDHVPGMRAAAKSGDVIAGTIDTWLIWNLTGGLRGGLHLTDVTNASRTLLMNLRTRQWDDAMLELLGIERKMLPTIVPSNARNGFGNTRADGPFGAAIPICGILGDQQAAMVGQACFEIGESKNTYGTGCFVLLNTGEQPVKSNCGLLSTVAYEFENRSAIYALEGSIAVTGALVQWLRDNLGIIRSAAEIESLAETVADNGGVSFVPAFSGLFAPHWRGDARGVIAGLTRHAHRGHLARAALEAAALQTCDVIDAMRKDSNVALTRLKVDGGMTMNNLLMQTQADLLNVPVVRPKITETTALGAAYAAGLAIGFWNDLSDLRANWQADRTWTPSMSEDRRQSMFAQWRKAIDRTLDWAD